MDVVMEFDPLSADFFEDPYETYRWLRDERPVYFNERHGFWALSRYEDVSLARRGGGTSTTTHRHTREPGLADVREHAGHRARPARGRGARRPRDDIDHLTGPARPRPVAEAGEPG